jgi:hypothetical protein
VPRPILPNLRSATAPASAAAWTSGSASCVDAWPGPRRPSTDAETGLRCLPFDVSFACARLVGSRRTLAP